MTNNPRETSSERAPEPKEETVRIKCRDGVVTLPRKDFDKAAIEMLRWIR